MWAPNTAGSFPYASLYPGMGTGVTQTMETTPEAAEQEALANIDTPQGAPVDGRSKLNIGILLIGLVLLVVLFGKG